MNISDIQLNLSPFSAENRQHPRAFITVAVTMEVGDNIIRGAECRNISMGGMFVFTDQKIPMGASGTVTLTKRCGDKRYSFSADFTVTRVEQAAPRGPGIGIYFKHLGETDSRSLKNIVDFHLSLMIKEKLNIRPDAVDGFTFKLAQTRDELEQAFRIVHDSYVAEGYMEPHPSGMRLTLYNSLPQAATFIGVKDGQVVMATTLYPDSFLGLPMDSIYEQDLKPLRDSGRFLAEVGAFAAHPDHRDTNPTLPLHIQKALYRYATEYLAIDDMVITINPKHRLYYQYLVLCDLVGEEKLYDFVNGARAVAMHNDLRTLPDRLARMYDGRPANKDLHDFFIRRTCDSIGLPAEKKPAAVWTRELIGYFFEEKTDIFAKADKKVVRFIKTLYV